MSDLERSTSLAQRLWQNLSQRRFLARQLKHNLHPKSALQFFQSLWQSHRYLQETRIKTLPLSQLPVCLVLGEAQSGKSSLLDNAGWHFFSAEGLNSRYQPMAARSMPQLRHSHHKLCIELPTYLFINESAKHIPYFDYWLAFYKNFGYLEKTRELILTISLEKLIDADENTLKQRDEFFAALTVLVSKLPKTVHCYVVITKIDRLLGFSEFFDDLSLEERQLACGISLNPNALQESFQKQFQLLAQRLTERLFWRCHGEHQLKRRLLVADFPQQFIRMESILATLVQYCADIAQLVPQFRVKGFYWTSHVQQGNLIDLLNQQNLAFKHTSSQSNLPLLLQRKAFFVRGFFQHLSVGHITALRSGRKPKTKPRRALALKWRFGVTLKTPTRGALKALASLVLVALLSYLGYSVYQRYCASEALVQLQNNPSLAYALMTSSDPKQALIAYVRHTIPNATASQQQALIDAPETQASLQQAAKTYVNQAWQQHVLSFYDQNMRASYPLDPHSHRDVSLKTFAAFFGPKGLVSHFQQGTLAALTHADANTLTPEARRFFTTVSELQRLFFNAAGQPTLNFNLSPTQLGSDIHQLDLVINGTQLSAKPKAIVNIAFVWPNPTGSTQSGYSLQKTHGLPQSFIQQGLWSWLVLLQQFQWKDFSRNNDGSFEGSLVLKDGNLQLSLSSHQDLAALMPLFSQLTPPATLL